MRHAKHLERELESVAEDEQDRYEAAKVMSLYRRELWTTTAAVLGGLGLMAGYMFHYGLLTPLLGGEAPQQHNYHGSARGRDSGDREKEEESDEADGPETSTTPLAQMGDLGAALEALPETWVEAPQRGLI
jgi:hypothetical protein